MNQMFSLSMEITSEDVFTYKYELTYNINRVLNWSLNGDIQWLTIVNSVRILTWIVQFNSVALRSDGSALHRTVSNIALLFCVYIIQFTILGHFTSKAMTNIFTYQMCNNCQSLDT